MIVGLKKLHARSKDILSRAGNILETNKSMLLSTQNISLIKLNLNTQNRYNTKIPGKLYNIEQ